MYISFFLHLLILSSFGTTTFALWIVKQDCSTSDNYTSGSTFRSNLDQFLSSVTEKTVKNDWFFNDTVGKAPYQVYGLARCYFDVFSSDRCRICLTEAALNITQRCPYSSSAAVWYYECFLRYSQQNFFTIESTSTTYVERSVDEVSDPEIFSQVLGSLMAKLSNDVVNSSILVAVGEANYTTFQKVYGLVECTRDLPALQCQRCIVVDLGWLPHGSNVARAGSRMFGPSCYLRYELYPFCPTIPPPPSPLQPIDSQDRKKSLITRYIIIALACAVALLLVILITSGLLCFRRKRSRTIDNDERQQRHSAGSSADIRKPNFQQGTKLIMFDFDTIQEATDNFSDENKLGEGGFGQVFKGRLQNGPELAVKRLATTSVQGIVELKNEVELLGRLTHRNLVRVLGYCIQEKEKLLCYEYLSNGSLDMILFGDFFSSNYRQ
ncbi:hypothetical protein LUZ60_005497 [Juncus effusus]|nr:hypothetical protein LUZ60_005497 [Juncus effusus]